MERIESVVAGRAEPRRAVIADVEISGTLQCCCGVVQHVKADTWSDAAAAVLRFYLDHGEHLGS
jgi:hypothetical protein